MSLPLTKKLIALGIAIDIIIADQISKWAITEILLRPQSSGENGAGLITWLAQAPEHVGPAEIAITPFFNLVMVWNQGVSFGMLSNNTESGPMILMALALTITAFFTIWLWRSPSMVQGLSIALVIGGAIGNTIDRARFGAVIDFLDVHALGYHWPAFNIADSAVVIGVGILILHSLFLEKREQK